MKEVYNKLFNKVASRVSDDELFGRVLNSCEGEKIMDNNKTTKKHGMKMIIAPLAAAIVTAGTAVGAMAVYSRNLSQEYNNVLAQGASVFPQEYKNADGEAITLPIDNELYEQLNIVVDKVFRCDGFTLEVPGAICDGKDMIVMYNVIFDEEPKYDENENVYMDYTIETDGVRYGYGHYSEKTFSKRDGKTVLSGFIEFSKIENCTDTVKVKLDNLWGSSMGQSGEGVRNVDIDLEIPLTGDITQFNKTVNVPAKPHIDLSAWGEWDMTDIEITPLSVTFNMSSNGTIPDPRVHKDASPDFPMIVTFKDGTTLDVSERAGMSHGIDSETKTTMIKRAFNFPINVDDVQSVQIASAVINMDGTAQTVEIPEINDHYLEHSDQK